MIVCTVFTLPKMPYIHRIYICMYGSGQPYTYGPQATHLHAQCRMRTHTHSHTHTHLHAQCRTDAHQVLVHAYMPTRTSPCTPDRTLSHMALKPHTCTPNAGLTPIRCWCMSTCQHAHALAHQTAPFHTFQKGQG